MDSVNSDLIAELRKMREGLDQMKSDLGVTKKVNNLLSERLQTKEKQCWANAQYPRRKCLKISGIPSSVSDNVLEYVACKAITKTGKCLIKTLTIVTELVKGTQPSLSFVK